MASFATDSAAPAAAAGNTTTIDGYPNTDPAAMAAYRLEAPEGWDGPPMTVRFVKGCDGDVAEAWRRYGETWAWRKEENINDILNEPQEDIDHIKANYPHAFHRRTRSGQLVYIERLGGVNINALKAGGVNTAELLRYYVKITEFAWRVLDTREEGKLCTILDMRGVSLSDIGGDVKAFLTGAASVVSSHYVERSYKIFVIGVPRWFTLVWAIVKPFLHANTRKKVTILGSSFHDELLEHVAAEHLPPDFGGTDTCEFGTSPEELELLNHIKAVNAGAETKYVPAEWPSRNPMDVESTAAPLRSEK